MFLFHDKCLFCKHFCLFVLFFKQRYLHFCLRNHPCCTQQLCKKELARNHVPQSCTAWVWVSGCPAKRRAEPPAPCGSSGSELQAATSTEELPGTCPVPVPAWRQRMVGAGFSACPYLCTLRASFSTSMGGEDVQKALEKVTELPRQSWRLFRRRSLQG